MFDRYADFEQALERPARKLSDALELATRQLQAAKVAFSSVCVALQDSIVYRDPAGRVMTAWTRASDDGNVTVSGSDEGMPPWPSDPSWLLDIERENETREA